jgi:hypothetical protein
MNPSTSTNERHSDSTKAAFLKQAVAHERRPLAKRTTHPVTTPFIFKQTYTLSSGGQRRNDFTVTAQRSNESSFVPSRDAGASAPIKVTSQAFSSFNFHSSPENISSASVGEGCSTKGQPKYLSLRVQKEWGGASMTALAMKANESSGAARAQPAESAETLKSRLNFCPFSNL